MTGNSPGTHTASHGDVCPHHGEVLAIRGACPWGDCETRFTRPLRGVPTVSEALQRALEATTLYHLTEPRMVAR